MGIIRVRLLGDRCTVGGVRCDNDSSSRSSVGGGQGSNRHRFQIPGVRFYSLVVVINTHPAHTSIPHITKIVYTLLVRCRNGQAENIEVTSMARMIIVHRAPLPVVTPRNTRRDTVVLHCTYASSIRLRRQLFLGADCCSPSPPPRSRVNPPPPPPLLIHPGNNLDQPEWGSVGQRQVSECRDVQEEVCLSVLHPPTLCSAAAFSCLQRCLRCYMPIPWSKARESKLQCSCCAHNSFCVPPYACIC